MRKDGYLSSRGVIDASVADVSFDIFTEFEGRIVMGCGWVVTRLYFDERPTVAQVIDDYLRSPMTFLLADVNRR
jgi:hypothetical protein